MSIYGSAVKNPITTILIFVAIIIIGLYSLMKLPIDFYPEIEYPALMVFTSYNGASASDIEMNISKPLEDRLNTISNLKKISSVSRENISVVTLEFEYGTDLNDAANNVRDALSFVSSYLPEDAETPIIFKFSTNMMPIMFFAITADESYVGIEKELENKLVNPLNRIDGIGSISLIGAPKREIAVNIDPRKMEAYNITIEQIGNILRAENLNMPLGNLETGKMDYPLRIQGEFTDSEQIQNIVLGNYNGKTVFLKDVAEVKDTIHKMTMDEKINGKKGIRMIVMKQSGANTVKIANEVKKQLPNLVKTLPPDVKVMSIIDTSDFIKKSINNLASTLIFAFIFVLLVVIFFLGRWRATFIIIITIPISLIVAFIYLRITGNTLNIISLSALSIAIGMVVDDAIVVLENITRHIERGSTPREASIYATNEVWLAVIATTLTIVAVFFPLTLISGLTGILFKQLGWTVTIVSITSTIAAITLTPMLSSKLLAIQYKKRKTGKFSHQHIVVPMLNKLDNFYVKVLNWSLKHKKVIVIGSFAIFITSMVVAKYLKTDFIPQADEGRISAEIQLQPGIRVNETVKIARKIEDFINAEVPEKQIISISSGANDQGGFLALFQNSGSNIINITMRLSDKTQRKRSSNDIADLIRKYLAEIPEIVKFKVNTTSRGMRSAGGGNTVDVNIYGYDFNQTTTIANDLAERIKKINGARDVTISREDPKPELRIILDKEKMARMGLNTATLSALVRNRVYGYTASTYREEGNEYNIVVKFDDKFKTSFSDIENIGILTPSGVVRLGDVGKIEQHWAPPTIQRQRRERIVTISTTPYKISLGELANKIQAEVDKTNKPSNVIIDVGGSYQDLKESFSDLALLLVLSLILVYIVMASQFESLKMPLIIMISVPFAFTGVILALLITKTTLSVIAALGAIMLIGIVVKNAIVMVDFTNLMRERGYELDDAIKLAGRSRLRPILMTTITTILGMLPLALSTGEGSEIWSPMGISVIGGLTFSTIITLIIVPVAYRIVVKRSYKKIDKELVEVIA